MTEQNAGVEIGSTRWDELVEIGRASASSHNWTMGDCLLEIEPMKASAGRGTGECTERMVAFAEEVGDVSVDTVKRWRFVSSKWPQDRRNPNAPWTVHSDLTGHPQRFSLILTIKPTTAESKAEMRRYRQANPVPAGAVLTPRQSVEVARRAAAGEPKTALAAEYGTSLTTVQRAARGLTGYATGRKPDTLFRKVTVGLTPEEFAWMDLVRSVRDISEAGYIRDLIDEDMKAARRRERNAS